MDFTDCVAEQVKKGYDYAVAYRMCKAQAEQDDEPSVFGMFTHYVIPSLLILIPIIAVVGGIKVLRGGE